MQENNPEFWRNALPQKEGGGHKYDYGFALIYAADELTGATRLAASACARAGAGLVTVLAPREVANVFRSSLPAHIMVRDDMAWTHEKVSAKLYGCGGLATKVDYESAVPTVLDAAALENLPDRIPNHFVLTPHEGEFAKTFPDIKGNKAEKALAAAKKTGAHIVLKGAETVIAAPDGSCVVNRHSSAVLATAGSGDILAGMITGLVAQGMPVFKACAAATWIHGECAIRFGKGLVAEDIIDMLPVVFQDI